MMQAELEKIMAAIAAYDTIIIHRHQRPDPDAIGSQLGLKLAIQATYPSKKVYAVGFSEPSLLFMGAMDEIADDLYDGALVIINDTANTGRIDDKRYLKADKILKIDHHPNIEPYGDEMLVDTSASSVSEMWADFILNEATPLKMTDEAARLFFLGIVGDTGRFLYDNTSAKTLEIAACLRHFQFKASDDLYHIEEQSFAQMKLRGRAIEAMQIDETGRVAWIDIPKIWLDELGLSDAQSHSLVQIPGLTEGILVWVIFVEQADGTIRCRLRSKGPAINGIASQHNGGGHPKASGAMAYSLEDKANIIAELIEASQNYQKV